MDKRELKTVFTTALENERLLRGVSQWEMAEQMGMSVSGYRKIEAGTTDSISIYTAYAAAQTLGVPLSVLFDENGSRHVNLLRKIYTAPDSTLERINSYLDMESALRHAQAESGDSFYIDVINLTGYMDDGMTYDSMYVEKLKLTGNYGAPVHKGVRVCSDALLPVYATNDILLLEERAARDGDTVVAMNLLTKKVYIRHIVMNGTQRELHPIHGRGRTIAVGHEDKRNWFDIGCVVTSVHEYDAPSES